MYKRQDLINGEESNTYSYMAVLQKLLTDNGYNLTVINKTPVSYTHLDVYKRQSILIVVKRRRGTMMK